MTGGSGQGGGSGSTPPPSSPGGSAQAVAPGPAAAPAGPPRVPTAGAGTAAADLLRTVGRWPGTALAAVVLSFVGAALSLVPVLMLRDVVDAVATGAGTDQLPRILVLALAAVLGVGLVAAAAETALGTLIARVLADLRERAVASVLRLPTGEIERFGRGDVIGRVGADVAVLVSGARTAVPAILSALVLVVTASGGIAGLDWRLALAGLLSLPCYVVALRLYLGHSGPLYRQQRAHEATVLGSLMSSVDGLGTVRSHGLVDHRRSLTTRAAADSRDTSVAAFRRFSRLVAGENLAEFTGLAALTVVGWLLLRAGHVTIGDVTAATILFHRQFVPVGQILFSFDEAQRSGAALTRIIGLIRLTGGDAPAPVDPHRLPTAPVDVEVRGLRHTYPDGRRAVGGVDLHIPAGRTLAVVGGSGAGKSTVAGIIAGTVPHPATGTGGATAVAVRTGSGQGDDAALSATPARTAAGDGTVTVGGRSLRDLGAAARRGLVCVASQDTHVFAGTLRDDLRLADPRADDATLTAALHAVGLGPWLAGLPDGLDTAVGEGGVEPDGATVQRLSLARIAVSPAPVVVLDESTAEDDAAPAPVGAVAGAGAGGPTVPHPDAGGARGDRDTPVVPLEAAAVAAVRGRTALVIAHRLSQAVTADEIAVMDGGTVVEHGHHVDLLAAGGRYADLWAAWSGTEGEQC
ncbi:ABC transporter ATP-binding protein [Corynebacterium bovis]|uniref:ATP-binding cassette subfamily C protein n=5 Tax=Corynebacterium bovis TaxID=36808 RepID=A0A8H9Y7M5_9CORY|nr:ABC transporter ATP-binding protein [Corynebacterium bovis]MBB3115880.1 ATP-binding cassette subfamily C protein [Corynebacterium bovis DSM 20582 = CIP 54.80]QQC46846.1 ABC transporter ATP-binding protein [Corynebacterium bovis]RRQ12166.1 ABC transporter ATP-binding protein [Corynebacterium bovis]RRQ15456.1 ABC transporter ATP-binding protein [Corynebacterium bovis]WJY78515.1 Putative multidrug export ATP-binding/permease protein [Corynebacterium bovis DSM 20582 = CIP 54.80]